MTTADDEPFPCPRCGGLEFEPGFVDDDRQGRVRWLAGVHEANFLGLAKGRGIRRKTPVIAYRCVACSRLELYAVDPEAR